MRAVKILGAFVCFVSVFVAIIASNFEGGVVVGVAILGLVVGFVAFVVGRLFDKS